MEAEFAVFLVAAIGALALAARALGNMAATVKALNDELQETVRDRRTWNDECERLRIAKEKAEAEIAILRLEFKRMKADGQSKGDKL